MQITRIREEQTWASDPVLQEYLDAKAAADRANDNLKNAQAALIQHMRVKQIKTSSVTYGGVKRQVTFVQRETYEIDEKGLRKELTAKVFDRYTVKKLDRKKLEEAMAAGAVDSMLVAKHTNTKESEPYLKYSQKEVDEDQDR